MLILQGTARNARANLQLAIYLSAIAGALNAAAFYAVGFFSANMTGNVSTLSDHLATGQWRAGLFCFAIVLSFITGAILSTLFINAGKRRGMREIYAYSILTEAVLLLFLGAADLTLADASRVPVLVLGLAFLMGLQNATVTRISDAHVRTTHVSGMATDIGIEIGVAIDILRGRQSAVDAVDNRRKLMLHAMTIGAFLLGGVVGVLLYQTIAGYLLIVCSLVLLLIGVKGVRRVRRSIMEAV